jgi:RNA polymerase sigma-70 factor, ECF subfamily
MSDTANAYSDEAQLLSALRAGVEAAFEHLIDMYHTAMVRLASIYTPNRRVAEEAVQETWIAVLQGLDRFEGRSSLKTWIFSILVNRARTIAQREGRYVLIDSLEDAEPSDPVISRDRFYPADHPQWPNTWISAPPAWDSIPERKLESDETRRVIEQAIGELPANQRAVITLRDMEELSSEEACNILEISETNQRVLLHRARTRVRRALERYFVGE